MLQYSPAWDIPEESGEGKFSQWTELQTMHLAVYFIWKEKWSDVQLISNLWAVANDLTTCSGTWKEYGRESDNEGLGRGTQIDPSEW